MRFLAAQSLRATSLVGQHAKSLFAVGIKINGAVFSFLVTFLIARASGATVTGYYSMALVTVNMAATIGIIGLDLILIRVVAGELRVGRPDLAWAGLRRVSLMVGSASLVLSILLFALAGYGPEIGVNVETVRAASPAVFAVAMLRISVVSLRAHGSILLSQFLDSAHNFTLVLLLGAYLWFNDFGFVRGQTLAIFYTSVVYLSAIVGWTFLYRRTRHWERGAKNEHPLLGASWKILLTTASQALTAWVILAQVGAMLGAEEVGAYRTAAQIVTTIQLMTTTLSNISAPEIAGHFRARDLKGAWRTYKQTTILMILAAGVPATICLLMPQVLLGIFGPEFVIAASALMIMALGQVVSAAAGPMGTMTVMSGNEDLSMILAIVFLFVSAGLAALLVPPFGMVGAATAGATATISRNIITVLILRRRLRHYVAAEG